MRRRFLPIAVVLLVSALIVSASASPGGQTDPDDDAGGGALEVTEVRHDNTETEISYEVEVVDDPYANNPNAPESIAWRVYLEGESDQDVDACVLADVSDAQDLTGSVLEGDCDSTDELGEATVTHGEGSPSPTPTTTPSPSPTTSPNATPTATPAEGPSPSPDACSLVTVICVTWDRTLLDEVGVDDSTASGEEPSYRYRVTATSLNTPADLVPDDEDETIVHTLALSTGGGSDDVDSTGDATDGSSDATDTAVLAATDATPGPVLPDTGSVTSGIASVAVVLIAVGVSAIAIARRRRPAR